MPFTWARFTVEAQAQLEREGAIASASAQARSDLLESGGAVEVGRKRKEVEEKPAKEKE